MIMDKSLKKYLSERWSNYNGESELFGLTMGGFNGNQDFSIKDFNLIALDWAASFANACGQPIRNINTNHSSYGLKHLAERYAKIASDNEVNYISNGTLILAMVDAGFEFRKIDNSPNVYFNVSERAIKAIAKIYNR
jgi:hypothetical protein